MLVFILFGVQYLHNDVFSFEIGLIHQKHSLNYHSLIKIPSSKIPLFLPLLSIWKTLIHFRVFIVSTIYINNDMFEADLFFLLTLPAQNVKEIRWKSQPKIMISLLITSYLETESEIKEKLTKQPWFLDCHQLLLSMFCRIAFCVGPLPCTGRRPSVLSNTPSWNRITGLVSKWRLPLMFTVEINWFHTKKSVKWPYKQGFYAFMCFSITENQSLWAFQSNRLIPPVLHTPAIKVTKIMQFLLIWYYHFSVILCCIYIISVILPKHS